jgi:hypothetical protein
MEEKVMNLGLIFTSIGICLGLFCVWITPHDKSLGVMNRIINYLITPFNFAYTGSVIGEILNLYIEVKYK